MEQDSKATPEEMSLWAAEYLKQAALEKEEQRKRDKEPRPRKSFLKWLGEHSTGLMILVTAVGALWTANLFIVEQREKTEQQKREGELRQKALVAQFAIDLGDKAKRNGAAYAQAVLAREDAILLLSDHLREAVKSEEDKTFRDALVRAFITIGRPSLAPMVDMNRHASRNFEEAGADAMIEATQSVILHFIKSDPKNFIETKLDLSEVSFRNVNLGFNNLASLNLSKVKIREGNFCSADMHGVNLDGASFSGNVQLGGVNLEGASLNGASFSRGLNKMRIGGANLSRVTGENIEFDECDLQQASLRHATLKKVNFSDSTLESADLSEARILDTAFSRANLFASKLINAVLTNCDFQAANLENADFSGADLAGARFFFSSSERPLAPNEPGTGYAALVTGANFDGAKNLSDDTRIYLCKWGAINVPRGCDGIPREKFEYQYKPSGFGAGSCW